MAEPRSTKRLISRRAILAAGAGSAAAALLAACGDVVATTTAVAPTIAAAATQVAPAANAAVASAGPTIAAAVTSAAATIVPAAASVAPTAAAAATTIAATTAPTAAATTAASSATKAPASVATTGSTTEISFFFPSAASGPIVPTINGYVDEFNKQNNGIKVTPTYIGGYTDVTTKIQTTIDGGGQPPETAVLLSTDLYALKDADYIVPFTDYLKGQDAYLNDFYPAFMKNSMDGNDVYGIPFQRSTPVMYYNKDLFQQVGLNPDQPPQKWADMVDAAKKLVKADGSRWGVEIPSDGFPYWVFQGMAIGNGKNYVDPSGNKVYFNDPAVVQALQAWVNLGATDKVAPNSIVVWATTPADLIGGKTAIAWHTTGSLTDIVKQSTGKFQIGVSFLPGLKGPGAPTGGGNFYIFKKTPKDKQQAAFKFIQYLSSPEMEARWTVDSGYVAARKSAWDQPVLKDYAQKVPQVLVARDQLQYADKEFSTHSGPQVQKAFGDELQAALTGKKTPQQAMDDAQKNVDNVLKQFR